MQYSTKYYLINRTQLYAHKSTTWYVLQYLKNATFVKRFPEAQHCAAYVSEQC